MPVSHVQTAEQSLEDASTADTRAIPINVQAVVSRGRETMGEVAAKIRIMPTSLDVNLNALRQRVEEILPKGTRLRGFAEEPIAFGLKALIAVVIVGDMEGGTEKVEEAISRVEDVESVQVIEVGRTF